MYICQSNTLSSAGKINKQEAFDIKERCVICVHLTMASNSYFMYWCKSLRLYIFCDIFIAHKQTNLIK